MSRPGLRPTASCNCATISTTATALGQCRSRAANLAARAASLHRLAHRGRDPAAEQFDRAHGLRVRHGADAHLHQIALMPQLLVLVEDLLDHLFGTADG